MRASVGLAVAACVCGRRWEGNPGALSRGWEWAHVGGRRSNNALEPTCPARGGGGVLYQIAMLCWSVTLQTRGMPSLGRRGRLRSARLNAGR